MNDKGEPPDIIMCGSPRNFTERTSNRIEYNVSPIPTMTMDEYVSNPENRSSIIQMSTPLMTTAGITAADISLGGHNIQDEIEKIWERLNKTVALVHNCANCGAKLEIEENHPIFHCKYCGSTYIIGATQPNSRY